VHYELALQFETKVDAMVRSKFRYKIHVIIVSVANFVPMQVHVFMYICQVTVYIHVEGGCPPYRHGYYRCAGSQSTSATILHLSNFVRDLQVCHCFQLNYKFVLLALPGAFRSLSEIHHLILWN
jgi:hypothetical protein